MKDFRDGRDAGIQGAVLGSEVGKRVLGAGVTSKYKGLFAPFLIKNLMDESLIDEILSSGETGALLEQKIHLKIRKGKMLIENPEK